jgi:hypothetical protein
VAAADYPALVLENDRLRVVRRECPRTHRSCSHLSLALYLADRDLVCRDHLGQVTLDTRLAAETPQTQPPTWQDFPPPISWKTLE